jgi:glutathione S-transferase
VRPSAGTICPVKNQYTLYGRQSSGSLAVQVALEELGVPYERIWVSREPADVERLKKLNSTGKVPALILPDGTVMFESAAMLLHLSLQFPQQGLAPAANEAAHATFLQWMVFLSANVYEAALRMYYPARYSSRGEADAAAVQQQGAADFMAHLGLISQSLKPYVLGSRYSIADVYLYMLGTWFQGDRQELYGRLPALGSHAKLLLQRPAVVKVEADHAQ